MAILLEATYSKKLGLPQFSSHSYSVTVRTELSDPGKVQEESSRLYQLLQQSVDREIQNAGFLPSAVKTLPGAAPHQESASHRIVDRPEAGAFADKGSTLRPFETGAESERRSMHGGDHKRVDVQSSHEEASPRWSCTQKQQDLILRLVRDNRLDKNFVELLSRDMFGEGVRRLNALQASGLIEELLERYPRQKGTRSDAGRQGFGKGASHRKEAA